MVLDESKSPALHRWLSFCRILMQHHPRVGAEGYAVLSGQTEGMKLGWNAVHLSAGAEQEVRYILISAEEGLSTNNKPDVPEAEFNHVFEDNIPDLRSTNAWRLAVQLEEVLKVKDEPGFGPDTISAIMSRIERSSEAPLRGDDEIVDHLVNQAIEKMKAAMHRGGLMRGGKIPVQEFQQPAIDIINSYMAYEITGRQAGNALGSILLFYCLKVNPHQLLVQSPPPPIDRILSCVDHLAETTYALLNDRMKMNLSSFYDMTYLAILYGFTASVIVGMVRDPKFPLRVDERFTKILLNKDFLLDEKIVHEALPSLYKPPILMPFMVLETLQSAKITLKDSPDLYPGARSQIGRPIDLERMLKALQEHSAKSKAIGIREAIETEYFPIDKMNRKQILAFLTLPPPNL